MDILQVENVSKAYASHLALDDVSLSVPTGQVYGLLGPNGAGKTTLIRIINHITAPDSGQVLFDGHRITQADVANIGYLPEERGLYKKMKVGEQAIFFARLKGLSKTDATRQLREWFDKFDITSWWDKKVEELSKGMAQKIQFIVTVLHRPRLLIFDEPFSGFDPINANLLKEEILKLRDEGSTIIFSTHNMASVEEICDNITLINKSRNILSGNVEELRRRFFADRYDLTFTGDSRMLMERLQNMAGEFSILDPDGQGRPRISLHINETGPEARRALLAAANDTVDLYGFSESIASMNDIFIRAVSEDANR
ncbi:MAG: ATP-binding cassette domain-containing protein [Muribaculaceae bacterium]|nr:ATP-binding cassette domain-containing protein [Muribaculaceae bacterium]